MSEIPGISRRSRPAEAAVTGAGVAVVLLVLNAAVELARVVPYWSGPGLTGSDLELWQRQLLGTLTWGIVVPIAAGLGTFLALWLFVPIRSQHSLPTVIGRAVIVSLIGLALEVLLRFGLPSIRELMIGSGGDALLPWMPLAGPFVLGDAVLGWLDAVPVVVLAVVCLWQWRRSRAERERASVAVAEHA